MRCKIIGQNLRALSKAVRLMSKYSDYMNILAHQNGLTFQAANDSKSVFCEVIFDKEFFASFDLADDFECAVDMRSLVLVFRIINLGKFLNFFFVNLFEHFFFSDRYVESCKIIMESSFDKLLFFMSARFSVSREYQIPYLECTPLKCVQVSQKISKPTLRILAKVFADLFKHFPNSTQEATVWLFQDHLSFKTFIETEDEEYFSRPTTAFSMSSNEFSSYNFKENLLTTFNLRDIKAFLDFAVYQNQIINIYLQSNGQPLELSFKSKNHYSTCIIMATIELTDSEKPEPPHYKQSMNRANTSITSSQATTISNESLVYSLPINNNSNNNNNCTIVQNTTRDISLIETNNDNDQPVNDDDDQTDIPMSEDIPMEVDEIKKENTTTKQTNNSSLPNEELFSSDDNTVPNEDINNIVDILDNLPDFCEDETTESSGTAVDIASYCFNHLSQQDDYEITIEIDSD